MKHNFENDFAIPVASAMQSKMQLEKYHKVPGI